MTQHVEEEVPGRRLYEKLPLDVRERDQRRIPSPGHRITYDPVFGLAGDTVKRPPNNMEEWLKYNYAKQGGNLDDLNKNPFDFGLRDPNEGLDMTPIPTQDADSDDGEGDEEVYTEELIEPAHEEYIPEPVQEDEDEGTDGNNLSFGDDSIKHTVDFGTTEGEPE